MGITHDVNLEMYFISVSGNNTHPPIHEVSGTKRNQINVGIYGGIIGAVLATVACGIMFCFLRKRFEPFIYTFIYIYIYLYMCIYMYIYIYI